MYCAIKITKKHLPFITVLNNGVEPGPECLEQETFYTWGEDGARILTRMDLAEDFKRTAVVSVLILEERNPDTSPYRAWLDEVDSLLEEVSMDDIPKYDHGYPVEGPLAELVDCGCGAMKIIPGSREEVGDRIHGDTCYDNIDYASIEDPGTYKWDANGEPLKHDPTF